MHIFKCWRHPHHCLFKATSKARVRFDMSNKQSLRFEKYKHFIFHNSKYSLHLFKQSTVFGSGIVSTYKLYSVFDRKIFAVL